MSVAAEYSPNGTVGLSGFVPALPLPTPSGVFFSIVSRKKLNTQVYIMLHI